MDEKLEFPDKTVNIVPFDYAISIINGKWKMHILFWLWKQDVMRYSEIKRALGNLMCFLPSQWLAAWSAPITLPTGSL